MSALHRTWAIVLAAGEGSRLSALTTRGGVPTPKQFCSLRGGRSLLGDALARARRLVPAERILVVVAAEHRREWEREVGQLPRANVVVQARNRGTAPGILLPLLTVLERDPGARVALLPSDHFVADEAVLGRSLREAVESVDRAREAGVLTLLGIAPDSPDTGYGWIVPGPGGRTIRPVARFVEKPDARAAAELYAAGALWNSFVFAARGKALLRWYAARLPCLLASFHAAFAAHGEARTARLASVYDDLAPSDFSRDLLQGQDLPLTLTAVPPCGWTDLGTPERIAACLANLDGASLDEAPVDEEPPAVLDLASALASWSRGSARQPA